MDLFDLLLFINLFGNVNLSLAYDKDDLQLFVLYHGEKVPLKILAD